MSWSRHSATRNLVLYGAYTLFGSLDFARGLFVVFLIGKGLSLAEVGVLQTVLFWSSLLAEVPAGVIADKTKRKYSTAFGCGLLSVSAALMPFAGSFESYILLFVVHGTGFAFRSGADSALLYDGLKAAGPEWSSRYVRISGRMRSINTVSLAIGIALGGVLHRFGWPAVYAAFAASMALSGICTLLIAESDRTVVSLPGVGAIERRGVFYDAVRFLTSTEGRVLLLFLLGMGFIEAAHTPFFIYGQVMFKEYGMDETAIGLVISGSMIATALGYLFVGSFGAMSLPRLVSRIGMLTAVLSMLLFLRPHPALAVVLFVLVESLPSLMFVHTDNHVHACTPSEIRATVLSLHSLVSSVFISVTFLIVGDRLDSVPATTVLACLGALPLASVVCISWHFRRARSYG